MDIADVDVVTVLGAGNMGHGIAEVAALAGYDVRLRDIESDLVEQGLGDIEWSLEKLADGGQITADEAEAALDRVEGHVDLDGAAGDADVVIEAVPERMDVKREVYADVEAAAPDDAVFASNTSSLSITDLAAATDRPERFCGMHFFNPPVKMPLVEVVAGDETAEETLSLVESLAETMDKTPIRVREDTPGFVVNRVLVSPMNEGAWAVHDGDATVREVDSAARYELGMPMGVFELADQVGIDVAVDVLEYMHAELGAAYEPCPLLEERVEADELGKKAGAGFYDYDDGGVDIPTDAGSEAIARRLEAVMANEVAKLLGDEVAPVEEIDRALQLGAGFPDGPARIADETGLDVLYDVLADRHEETGAARYAPAPELERRVEAGEGFYEGEAEETTHSYETIRVEREGRVAHVVLDREHRLNTVTLDMLDELEAAVEELADEDGVRSLLLTGAGDRAFSAGADVTSMASSADPLDGVELSRRGHAVFGQLEETDLPVVAGIDGYALGGGMELAAAADLRVAAEGSEFGQTEPNLGLMPGWGGTQRLPRIVGEGRAKEILLTGDRYDAATMAEYGFVNEVVSGEAFPGAALEMARDLADGPPIAQGFIKDAVHAGRDDGDAGLEVEAMAFGHLFGTEDLMEGITAFASDRDPEFEGE
ncbi:MAG: 3-hydroxyacyl-CoA dehydrogenase/enoyl-CoA hydratase family protein [Halobacteriaceae archaeon]